LPALFIELKPMLSKFLERVQSALESRQKHLHFATFVKRKSQVVRERPQSRNDTKYADEIMFRMALFLLNLVVVISGRPKPGLYVSPGSQG